MFQTNSRIERINGVHFYEQDIICNDYIFAGDMIVDMKLDYLSPGFGILFIEDNGKPANQADHAYLFKVGVNDFTVLYKNFLQQFQMQNVSCTVAPPTNDLNIVMTKTGQMIELKSGRFTLGHYKLPSDFAHYRLGFYSNAGNTLKSASIATGVPQNWIVNIKNTNGGRVNFFREGFTIEGCEYDAEVEQAEVSLKKGTYYIDFVKENVNEVNDIQCFVFHSTDSRFDDTEKDLIKDGCITLDEDTLVNIKFRGTSGTIKEITIKDDPKSAYVPTDETPVTMAGSYITIDLDNIKAVRWTGVIHDIPTQIFSQEQNYGVVVTKTHKVSVEEADVQLNKEYIFYYDVASKQLGIAKDGITIRTININLTDADENKLTVFQNVSAEITEIILTKEDGSEFNVLLQKTYKFYVPASIQGPITVIGDDKEPLDLSSSFRALVPEPVFYQFTNWEREIFEPVAALTLEKPILDASGNIRVYGILKDAEINESAILQVRSENGAIVDTIDLYTTDYELISEADFSIDYTDNPLITIKADLSKYKKIIIDYLKAESFCINYIKSLESYELDISSAMDTLYIIYDFQSEDDNGSVSLYQLTGIKPDKSKYIVLRKQ